MRVVQTVAWLACIVYSTIPLFWLMVHPRAHMWRQQPKSPFRVLVPAWILMWIGLGALTGPWREITLYGTPWSWAPALLLFAAGLYLYSHAGAHFSLAQLGCQKCAPIMQTIGLSLPGYALGFGIRFTWRTSAR